jgi:hypothetical protein
VTATVTVLVLVAVASACTDSADSHEPAPSSTFATTPRTPGPVSVATGDANTPGAPVDLGCFDLDPLVVLRRLIAAASAGDDLAACFYPGYGSVSDETTLLKSATFLVDHANLEPEPPNPPPPLGTDAITYRVPSPDTPRLENGTEALPPHQSGVYISLAQSVDGRYAITGFLPYVSS